MADPVPSESGRSIASVDAKWYAFRAEKSENLGLLDGEERSGNIWKRPLKGRESFFPGSANEVHEERLSDIVHGMSSHDEIEFVPFAEPFEESIANGAEPFFDIRCRAFFWPKH